MAKKATKMIADKGSTGIIEEFDEATPVSVRSEQKVSGDMPHPESDDNALDNAHDVGIAPDADEEHPKPLNIAGDVAKAEKKLRDK